MQPSLPLSLLLTSAAAAQPCDPSWAQRFAPAVITDSAATSRITSLAEFDPDGPGPAPAALYASGTFLALGGAPAYGVARWTGRAWEPAGSGAAGAGDLLVYDPEGPEPAALYRLGQLGGSSSIHRWNGTQWSVVVAAPTSGPDPYRIPARLFKLDADGPGPAPGRLYVAYTVQDASPAVVNTSGELLRFDPPSTLTPVFYGGAISSAVEFDPDGPSPLPAGIDIAHTYSSFAWSAPGNPPPTLNSKVTRLTGNSATDLIAGVPSETIRYSALAAFDDDGPGPAIPSLYLAGFYPLSPGGPAAAHLSRLVGSTPVPIPGDTDAIVERLFTLPADPFTAAPALYATGDFTTIGGTPSRSIARWNGVAWSALGPGFQNSPPAPASILALAAFDEDGPGPRPRTLFAGGDFTVAGYAPSRGIARWDGLYWSPPGPVVNNAVHALLSADLGAGPSLYLAGRFTDVAGLGAVGIARYDGQAFHNLSPGMNHHVDALAQFQGQLIAAGKFTLAGGVPANRVARWTGSIWVPLAAGLDGDVRALSLHNGSLFAAGDFTHSGAIPLNRIARWDGAAWSPLSTGMNAPVLALASYAGELYAAGPFTTAGGTPARGLARWNGSSWRTVGASPIGAITALAPHRGHLFAAHTLSPTSATVSAWNGESWFALPPISGPDARITALASIDEDGPGPGLPVLYISGEFTHAGSSPAQRLARWDGTSWSAPTAGLSAPALAIATFGSPAIPHFGGEFLQAGGQPSWHLAALSPCPAPCPGNCDASTTPPILNIADFICFQNRFAAQDPAANCDASTTPPILNVADFICFQQKYAAGCP